MNETEIIQGARELLSDPKRWHKGGLGGAEGTVCALGALGMVSQGHVVGCYWVNESHPLHKAWVLLKDHVPGGVTVQEYNDAESTTHADIITLLDKCLADLGALA